MSQKSIKDKAVELEKFCDTHYCPECPLDGFKCGRGDTFGADTLMSDSDIEYAYIQAFGYSKPKFDIKNYPGKYAMHVISKADAKVFCDYLHGVGRRWKTGVLYFFNEGDFSNLAYNYKNEYTYLHFEDFDWSDFTMNKQFTKKDLKNGDVVLRRDGSVNIVIVDVNTVLSKDLGNLSLGVINDDLTSTLGKDRDIIAVRRPFNDNSCCFGAFKHKRGDLVYERKEVEEMTLEEVCKALGKEIKIVKEK